MHWPSQEKVSRLIRYRASSSELEQSNPNLIGIDLQEGLDDETLNQVVQALQRKRNKDAERARRQADHVQTEGSKLLEELDPSEFISRQHDSNSSIHSTQRNDEGTHDDTGEPRKWIFDNDYMSKVFLLTEGLQELFQRPGTILHDTDAGDKPIEYREVRETEFPYVFFKIFEDCEDGQKHIYFTRNPDIENIKSVRDKKVGCAAD